MPSTCNKSITMHAMGTLKRRLPRSTATKSRETQQLSTYAFVEPPIPSSLLLWQASQIEPCSNSLDQFK